MVKTGKIAMEGQGSLWDLAILWFDFFVKLKLLKKRKSTHFLKM